MLSLGGCLLTGDKLDPAIDIPQVYDGGPKNPVVAEAAVPLSQSFNGPVQVAPDRGASGGKC